MPLMLGCQTITFGNDQKERFAEVFAAVARAGYQGVEIGFRHIADTPPAALRSMLAAEGLVLAATHLGGNLEDTSQARGERNALEQVLDYLGEIGVGLIMYSGLRYENDEQLASEIEMISRGAEACHARGVRLCYHNHDWEFADGERVMGALRTRASEQLWFCPDVGWVFKGGKNPVEFLDEVADRIGHVHFKDFESVEGERMNVTELGEGAAPLDDIARWLLDRKAGGELWIVAEQDKTALTPEESVTRNAKFLLSRFPQA